MKDEKLNKEDICICSDYVTIKFKGDKILEKDIRSYKSFVIYVYALKLGGYAVVMEDDDSDIEMCNISNISEFEKFMLDDNAFPPEINVLIFNEVKEAIDLYNKNL